MNCFAHNPRSNKIFRSYEKNTIFIFDIAHLRHFLFMLRKSGRNPPANGQKMMSKKFSINRPGQFRRNCGFGIKAVCDKVAGSGNIIFGDLVESGTEPPTDFTFTLRLRSGTPIRLALVRQKEIEEDFSKLKGEARSAFIQKYRGLVECPACTENYVLTLSSKSKSNPGADAVYTAFGGAKLADLQRYIYLQNDKGEKRQLAYFVPPKAPGEEAVFFFPRFGR